MDDERSDNWVNVVGVKVEGAVGVFPGIHVWGKGGLAEEVQGEFGLREELVPEKVGEVIGVAGEHRKEVSFKSVDGAFSYVAAMYIRRYKLESAVSLVNDGAKILGAGLIIEYSEIDAVAFGFEGIHDAVVGSHLMPDV